MAVSGNFLRDVVMWDEANLRFISGTLTKYLTLTGYNLLFKCVHGFILAV